MYIDAGTRAAAMDYGSGATNDDIMVNTPELMLMELEAESQAVDRGSAGQQVEEAHERLKELRERIREAQERAREAQEKGGFFGGISDVLGEDLAPLLSAAAGAAAIAATGGAATPLVIAAAAMTVSARVGEELGLDPRLCAALGVGGAVAGMCAGNVGAASNGFSMAAAGLRAGEGAAQIGAGSFAAVEAHYAKEGTHARADAGAGEVERQKAEDAEGDAIARIGRVNRSHASAVHTVQAMADERHEAEQSLLHNIGGRI